MLVQAVAKTSNPRGPSVGVQKSPWADQILPPLSVQVEAGFRTSHGLCIAALVRALLTLDPVDLTQKDRVATALLMQKRF